MRSLASAFVAAAAAAAMAFAPAAAAAPHCVDVGPTTTQCQTPGNVEISAEAPDVPTWSYPWDDEFYGSALVIGGGERG